MIQATIRCFRGALLGAALLAATPAAPCAASFPEIPDEAPRYKGWPVDALILEGVDKDLRESLGEGLALSGESKLLGKDKALFFVPTLREDLERTRLFLARHGMPDATIQVELEPRPNRKSLRVRFRISGSVVRVSEARVKGVPGALLDDIAPVLPEPGSVFQDAVMNRVSTNLVNALQQRGHARATVALSVEPAGAYAVTVVFEVSPGPVCYFRRVEVVGSPDNLEGLARRSTDISSGDRYHPRKLRRADESLRLLGVFGQIRVTTEPAGLDSVDVTVTVSERSPRTIEFGVGYWTDDELRVSSRWQHRNLFLGGRGFEISALYSKFEQRLASSTWWPAVPTPRSRVSLEAAVTRNSEPNYTQLDLSLIFSTVYRFSALNFVQAGLDLSRVSVTPKEDSAGEIPDEQGLVSTFFAKLEFDGTNDRIRPRSGAASKTRLEFAPEPLGVSGYLLAEEKAIGYVRLPLGAFVSGRMRVGAAHPIPGEGDLLPNRRFYSGGATSHRGFARRKLGPLDESGDALGGNLVFEGSVDLRFPLFKFLKGAAFVDTGQVWGRLEDVKPNQIEVAVGPGLWVDTPVGPFRVDYAVRVTTLSPEPRTQVQISIGSTL